VARASADMTFADRFDTRPFVAGLVLSLVVHGGAMMLVLPAARLAPYEPAPPLEVRLLEPQSVLDEVQPAAPAPPKPTPPKRVERKPKPAVIARADTPPQEPPAPVEPPKEAPVSAPEPPVAVAPPPPPVAAVAPPPPRVPRSDLLSGYGKVVSQALAHYKEYPRIAQMRGWEGSVTMRLRVAPTGQLIDAVLYKSSGHEVLDQQALAMAAKAERLPLPPEELRDGEIAVLVPVVFRLEP